MTIIYHRGITLACKPKENVFSPIPKKHYWNSLLYDIEKVEEKIVEEPAYYILNLCRILAYRKHGHIYSKTEAAKWGKKNLPEKFHLQLRRRRDRNFIMPIKPLLNHT